jgi:mannitol/fructose-specific phosphotransferase system IIA component (Ntr-type)
MRSALLSPLKTSQKFRLSEFLTAKSILFFDGPTSKTAVVEALVKTFPAAHRREALQTLWARERECVLNQTPEVVLLRGRLAGLHHLQAAMGICSQGVLDSQDLGPKIYLFFVLLGPLDQTRIHMNLLACVSYVAHRPFLIRRLRRAKSAQAALETLQEAEGASVRLPAGSRVWNAVREFMALHFAWGTYTSHPRDL